MKQLLFGLSLFVAFGADACDVVKALYNPENLRNITPRGEKSIFYMPRSISGEIEFDDMMKQWFAMRNSVKNEDLDNQWDEAGSDFNRKMVEILQNLMEKDPEFRAKHEITKNLFDQARRSGRHAPSSYDENKDYIFQACKSFNEEFELKKKLFEESEEGKKAIEEFNNERTRLFELRRSQQENLNLE